MKEDSDRSDFFSLEKDVSNLYKKDNYMKHCLVSNHIEPIALDDEIHILKKEEQKTFNLTDILRSLENKKEGKGEGDGEKSDVIFPEYVENEITENVEEEPDRINYGVYLHEVNIIDNTCYNSFSTNIIDTCSNPICIQGDMYIRNVVHFEDLSPYKSMYAVHKVEWFLGLDINDSQIHEIVPISQGMCFQIPFESLGKYIFCKAYRYIYVNSELQKRGKNTVFDPHTCATKPVKFRADPKYVQVCSITSKGPVLISIDTAFKTLTHLCNNNYSVNVIVEDPLNNLCNLSSNSSSDDDCTLTTLSNSMREETEGRRFVATLTVNFNEVKIFIPSTETTDKNGGENGKAPSKQTPKSLDNANRKVSHKLNNAGENALEHNFFPVHDFYSSKNGQSLSLEEIRNSPDAQELEGKVMVKRQPEADNGGKNGQRAFCEGDLIFNLYEVEFRLSGKEDCIIINVGNNFQTSFRSVKYKMITIKPVESNTCVNDLWVILLTFKSAHKYKKIFQKHAKRIYTNTNISFVQNMLNEYLTKSEVLNAATCHICDALMRMRYGDTAIYFLFHLSLPRCTWVCISITFDKNENPLLNGIFLI
ncbi:conserved Plasmodium protein, unknown function [Plasmodium ovale curtisi]|uniref:Uncharacterized protein n=1 Tax=Plasmodium ovale curtisi TaxID=864141 RepID=A0A1A8VUP2_PLAOA|nr:conserved Plasmodium protein, unknown function [Plasmodium ovale curtisi]